MAADQLGDLAREHPEDVLPLLSRVCPFLLVKKWETRVTAARAIGGIVAHAQQWDPNRDDGALASRGAREAGGAAAESNLSAKVKLENDMQIKLEEFKREDELLLEHEQDDLLSLDSWDLQQLFKSGKTFLAANVDDFSEPQAPVSAFKNSHPNSAENLQSPSSGASSPTSISVPSDLAQASANKKSARMLAMAKRKKKMQSKGPQTRPVDITENSISKSIMANQDLSPASVLQNPKMEITGQPMDPSKIMIESSISPILEKHERVAGLIWQFQGIYELLLERLMSDSWELRHGAALGIRELMKKHANGVSRVKGESKESNDLRNRKSLEDLAARLLTLFALDRFGDYVYDTVVAPVRESAAQTLATLLLHLDDELAITIFHKLEQLVLQSPTVTGIPNKVWEATHGGLLGVRYFVSIKTETLLHNNLLTNVVQIVLNGLNQVDDDVKSVAAAILSPITTEFVKLEHSTINRVLVSIWSSLRNLEDDLSSSVGSVMDLLAKLCGHNEILTILKEKARAQPDEWAFKSLVPELYPFLRHSIGSVRKAVLNLLLAFLSINDEFNNNWINGKLFRLLFQNILLEQNTEILNLSFDVYSRLLIQYEKNTHNDKNLDQVFSKHLQPMLHLMNTPIGEGSKNYSMEPQYLLKTSSTHTWNSKKRSISDSNSGDSDIPISKSSELVNIDAPMISGDTTLLGTEVIVNTRVLAAKAYGLTLSYFQETTLKSFFANVLVRCLDLPFATPRMLAAMVLSQFCSCWLKRKLGNPPQLPVFVSEIFSTILKEQLTSPSSMPTFRELVPTLRALRTQCQSMLAIFIDIGKLPQHKLPTLPFIVQGETDAGPKAFSIENAELVCGEYHDKMFKSLTNNCKILAKKPLEDAKHRVFVSIEQSKQSFKHRHNSVLSCYATAVLLIDGLPSKLNPVIRSLMDSIKEERLEVLQSISSDSVNTLIKLLLANGKQNVANKIVKNLCGFLCVDTTEVPEFNANGHYVNQVLTLIKEQQSLTLQEDTSIKKITDEAHSKRKGGLLTLIKLLETFGDEIFNKIPQLESIVLQPLKLVNELPNFAVGGEIKEVKLGQQIVDAFGILRATYPYMARNLRAMIRQNFSAVILEFLRSFLSVFRFSAARTLADFAKVDSVETMTFIIREVLPLMNSAGSLTDRQGSMELIYHLSLTMDTKILPYIIYLIVPLLGRMSDSDPDVRSLATVTFASIIKLVPLEAGIPDPEGLPSDLMSSREKERDFIQQMMDPSKAKPFELPVNIKADLRKYQQDGINWLAFLNKYHLHGILCDDMGLGKTLQTICIIASDQYLRQQDYKITNSVQTRPLPSLVICPPSLTGHWENEFEKYSPFLTTLVYAGGPSARLPLKDKIGSADIVITSYDVARNDLNVLTQYDYNYCVLDEGHIIKNSQSKLAKAVKSFSSNHRLILTGTPIQNNVVELWSLFDFLMPGFLGTEKMFQERFAKPISASRNSKVSSKEQEAGVLALEALHKQVLPFMLRRLKEDVLSDLPPKIIQDYYCELSDLQKQLYQDFAKKQKNVVIKGLDDTTETTITEEPEGKTHIFQALQYMRKLCNHPALVLSPNHPQQRQVEDYLKQTKMDLHDIANAPKLGSLRTLLYECGIGNPYADRKSGETNMYTTDSVISQHRALIFCQLKDMLDIVETDLFKKYMPSVTYMRLDGSVDPRDRQKVVKRFNEDPSIDCLLLTTKVGGLGLNLTGADTVIFIEHDWNPMNDLQAMDRTHRLGQTKVVNVYRIITKGTLEDKIMGLQKFKMHVAGTVINQQNSGLTSMDTHQLLDLFDTDNVPSENMKEKQQTKQGDIDVESIANETGLGGKAKEALGELKELWDPSQYEEEYNLDNFIKTLK